MNIRIDEGNHFRVRLSLTELTRLLENSIEVLSVRLGSFFDFRVSVRATDFLAKANLDQETSTFSIEVERKNLQRLFDLRMSKENDFLQSFLGQENLLVSVELDRFKRSV